MMRSRPAITLTGWVLFSFAAENANGSRGLVEDGDGSGLVLLQSRAAALHSVALGISESIGIAKDDVDTSEELAAFARPPAHQSLSCDTYMRPIQLERRLPCVNFNIDEQQQQSHVRWSDQFFIPVFSSLPFYSTSTDIENAVIVSHGISGNSAMYYCNGVHIAEDLLHVARTTLTLAPYFGNEPMPSCYWDATIPGNQTSAYWPSTRWLGGGNAAEDGMPSAFEVLDTVVLSLIQAKNDGRFPNLKKITFAGFSAGCQLGTRWGFFSKVAKEEMLQIVVGGCGTYMYLSPTRPTLECRQGYSTPASATCSSFDIPSEEEFPDYNEYKFGLSIPERLLPNYSYLRAFATPNSPELEEALTEFPNKNMKFGCGDLDSCNCKAPDFENGDWCFLETAVCSPSPFGYTREGRHCCDTHPDSLTGNFVNSQPGGLAQGSNRLERYINWIAHVTDFYRQRGLTDYQPTQVIFEGGHDAVAFYTSPRIAEWIYGLGGSSHEKAVV